MLLPLTGETIPLMAFGDIGILMATIGLPILSLLLEADRSGLVESIGVSIVQLQRMF